MSAADDDLRQLLQERAGELMKLPNVVGVGIASGEEANPAGSPVIAVYVREKVPLARLAEADVIPRTLTASIDGEQREIRTRIIIAGNITH